jgi:hypothetical protein
MAQFAAKLSSGVFVDHDLGVNDAVGVAILAPGATMIDGTTLSAERVKIAPGANVYNVQTNDLTASPASIHGSVSSVNPPLRANFCSLPSLTCGTGDLQVKDATAMLAPGNYGRVSVAAGAVLHLTGNGTYRFCDLRIANHAEVLVTYQVTVEVPGNVIVGTDSSFHTSSGSPFILRVGGPKLLLGSNALVTAAITAPNAKGKVKKESHLQGCMCADIIKAAKDSQLTCAGDGSPSGAFVD